MKREIYECNTCGEHAFSFAGRNTWITISPSGKMEIVTSGEDGMEINNRTNEDMHFCSDSCLIQFIRKQY